MGDPRRHYFVGVHAQTQLRLSEANSNFNSQNLPHLHFGPGDAAVDQWTGQAACPGP